MMPAESEARLSSVARLPLELLLHIFRFLPGIDIVHLLVTCRTLHATLSSQLIWKDLCTRFGVEDLPSSGFHHPDTTFFTVYSQLLHHYGPLLGIWASDNVFQGGIVEFRLVTESKEVGWEGIVGEIWQFPLLYRGFDPQQLHIPSLPTYDRFMQIELRPPTEPSELLTEQASSKDPNGRTHQSILRRSAVRFYRTVCPGVDRSRATVSESLSIPFRLNAPHRQAYYVSRHTSQHHNMTPDNTVRAGHVPSLHPIFPPTAIQRSCLEANRPMPRLKVADKEPEDQRDVVNGINNPHRSITVVYMAPFPSLIGTSADIPQLPSYHSLSFWPLTERDAYDLDPTIYDVALHPPSVGGFSDLRRMSPNPNPDSISIQYLQQFGSVSWTNQMCGGHVHWYPLRFSKPPSSSSGEFGTHLNSGNTDPGSEDWDPHTLTGLWLGAYHTHGTEVLYIEYDEVLCEVRAWKVTGDCNVPRGVVTWRFGCATAAQNSEESYGEIIPTDELLQEVNITETSAKAKVRMYAGVGTISQPGYLDDDRGTVTILAAVIHQNEIRCRWLFGDGAVDVPRYHRYLGRGF